MSMMCDRVHELVIVVVLIVFDPICFRMASTKLTPRGNTRADPSKPYRSFHRDLHRSEIAVSNTHDKFVLKAEMAI
jgi:hypothetical protein